MMPVHGRPLLRVPSDATGRPYLALNMVASVDGRATLNGSAIGIGSTADKRLMRELRAEADVVLHGAGTVRADPLSARVPAELVPQRLANGLSEQPLGAIVTRSGHLPADHPYYDSATVIYVVGDVNVSIGAPSSVEICHVSGVSEAVADLYERGARRILSEGGPTLNAALLEAELVDEIFLTVAPKLLGGANPLTIVNGGCFDVIPLELRSLVELSGELFVKYGVLHSSR
jgi:riboflavin-specific deaminase-like protein